jgi:Tfp pilus assembly protein PilF
MLKRTLALSLLVAGSCATTTTTDNDAPVRVNGQTSDNTGTELDGEKWNEARGSILRTFAFRALEKGLVEEARQYLTEACEADPGDVESHAALARLYLAEGDGRSALVYAERAATVAPSNPEISLVYAAALAENNREAEATETLETAWAAVEHDPAFARAVLTHYAALGDKERAEDFVARQLKEDPDHASSWSLAGDLLLADGDVEGAAESYRRALELDPRTPTPGSLDHLLKNSEGKEDAAMEAALRAEDRGDLESAANVLRFLISAYPADTDARVGMARVMWKMDRAAEADRHLQHVTYGQRNWRTHLLQAKIDVHFDRYGAAKSSLLLAQHERPGLKSIDLLLGYVDSQLSARAQAGSLTLEDI